MTISTTKFVRYANAGACVYRFCALKRHVESVYDYNYCYNKHYYYYYVYNVMLYNVMCIM